MSTSLPGSRTNARIAAVQALYEMDMTDAPVDPVLNEFFTERWKGIVQEELAQDKKAKKRKPAPTDHDFLKVIVQGVVEEKSVLDRHIKDSLSDNWTIDRLQVLIRAILRAGTYELLHLHETNARIVINEYVDVAHAFYDGTEPNLVNGVLDKLARDLCGDNMTDDVQYGPDTSAQ